MKTVGIIGEGQLAQLLGHSAYQLGLKTLCYTNQIQPPARLYNHLYQGEYDNEQAWLDFAKMCDVITFETEKIPETVLKTLDQSPCPIYPSTEAIRIFQNRISEKQLFRELGIPTVTTYTIRSQRELEKAVQKLDTPCILKVAHFGYDGKGQYHIDHTSNIEAIWQENEEQPAVLEAKLPFDFEVSLITARNTHGDMVYYPLVKNNHEDGILKESFFPFHNASLQAQAENYAQKLLTTLDYVGVLTIEFFVKDEELIANEVAPRVHNSGHLTIESTNCSQFENHLRAVSGVPIVKPEPVHHGYMYNLLGSIPEWSQWPDIPSLHFYRYGKDPKPKRKLGHITITAKDAHALDDYRNTLMKSMLY